MSCWDGSTSSKFGKTKRIINFVPYSDTSTQGLFSDVDTGIQRIKGKIHFSLPPEQRHYAWKSSIKIPETMHYVKRPSGIRRISPTYTEPSARPERKHVTPVRQETVGHTFNDFCEVKYQGKYVMNNRIW